MSLMKWFRRNNKKIMAVVVVVIMFGFIGGSYLQFLAKRATGFDKTVAFYGQNRELTQKDMTTARQDLDILKALGMGTMLRAQDIHGILLAEILFPDRNIAQAVLNRVKRMITTDGYDISKKQLDDIYQASQPNYIYWLLLKKEARDAGFSVPNQNSGEILSRLIPQLHRATYAQVVGQLVESRGIPEERLLAMFGDLLAVMECSKAICSAEDITDAQIRKDVSFERETIDVEFVAFNSQLFTGTVEEFTPEQLAEHFEKYKGFTVGSVGEQNPYGFGYKTQDRARLEYIMVKLDDVAGIIKTPTPEECEQYYQSNRNSFTREVPSDPNDPNAPMVTETRTYAQMADSIAEYLLRNKIDSKATRILQQARTITEADIEKIEGMEFDKLTDAQFEEKAGDYNAAAQELAEEHKIKVTAGKTGLLSTAQIQSDPLLGRLYPADYQNRLFEIVFAVDRLSAGSLGMFDHPVPRMYENIGPLKDMAVRVMMIVRVIDAQKASVPENIDYSFNRSAIRLNEPNEPNSEDIYLVKQMVTEDMNKLAAMATAGKKAHEFISQVEKDGWDTTVDKFNTIYSKDDVNEPNVFRVNKMTGIQRISDATILTVAAQSDGSPLSQLIVANMKTQRLLVDKLYSLVPEDANHLEAVPVVMEFKPHMSYYAIKNISVKRLDQDQFRQIKPMQAFRENSIRTMSLSIVYFNPDNIVKRLNYRVLEEETEDSDGNTADSNTASESRGKP